MTGIRTAESIQRLKNISAMFAAGSTMTSNQQVFPIYDWKDNDVWLYLYQNHIDIPVIYLYLWQSGTRKNQLRVSQFFSIDTARSLVKMNEYYPDLMERIIRREPNAYLAALYWDSEMFGRQTRNRKELEKGKDEEDYKEKLVNVFNNMDKIFTTPHTRHVAERYRILFLKASSVADNEDYRKIYEGLMAGDPKLRTQRSLYQQILTKYIEKAKAEDKKP